MVDDQPNLPAVQKLFYLKASLQGEANNLLKHFQVTEANYGPAWNHLLERYENKRILINTQLKILFTQANITTETSNGIKKLLDTTNETLQQLNNLGVNSDSWDHLLIYMTVQRLPAETHQAWEQERSKIQDLPTFEDLKKFLLARFRTLEMVGNNKSKSTTQQATPISSKEKPQQPSRTQAFHTGRRADCPVCCESHTVRGCPQFLKMTPGQKIETVKRKGLCLNCLGQGHKSSNCPSSKGCFQCKRKHHTLLHEQSDIGNSSSTTDNSNPTTSTTNADTQVNVHQSKSVSESGTSSVYSLHIPTIVVSGQVLLAKQLSSPYWHLTDIK